MLSEKPYPSIVIRQTSLSVVDRIRRAVDILIPLLSLFILWLPFLFIAIWIRRDSPGPILHRANRVGRNGLHFNLYKFRTMAVNADKAGPGITSAGDSRITRSGKFLRKTKLDELPQLFNVIAGDMSLVGPRPEDPHYVALYTEAQRVILATKPGITSAASLTYRNEEEMLTQGNWEEIYCTQIMPDKLAIDLDYLSKRTLGADAKLVVQTVLSMLR